MRTQVKNRIHSLLDKYTLRSPYNFWTKKYVAWLREQDFGFMDNAIVESQLAILETLEEQVRLIEDTIAAIAVDDPQVKLLMTMPGIGYFTASLLVAEIGDVNRFSNEKKISSWAGLAPRIRQSGEKTHIGHVGKGNKRVGSMMIQCAHTARRHDSRFQKAYKRVSRRGGKGKAVVAVALLMLRIVYFMLMRDEPYRGQNVEMTTRKLKTMEGRARIGLRI